MRLGFALKINTSFSALLWWVALWGKGKGEGGWGNGKGAALPLCAAVAASDTVVILGSRARGTLRQTTEIFSWSLHKFWCKLKKCKGKERKGRVGKGIA